jgi:hypothetical protein
MTEDKKPIIKLWFVKPTEAWYRLSEEEQHEMLVAEKAVFDKVREEYDWKGIIACDALWSTENWEMFGMEEWSDMEALRLVSQGLKELDWYRYFDAEIYFGTELGSIWDGP